MFIEALKNKYNQYLCKFFFSGCVYTLYWLILSVCVSIYIYIHIYCIYLHWCCHFPFWTNCPSHSFMNATITQESYQQPCFYELTRKLDFIQRFFGQFAFILSMVGESNVSRDAKLVSIKQRKMNVKHEPLRQASQHFPFNSIKTAKLLPTSRAGLQVCGQFQ